MSWKFYQLICLHRIWNLQNKIQIKNTFIWCFCFHVFPNKDFSFLANSFFLPCYFSWRTELSVISASLLVISSSLGLVPKWCGMFHPHHHPKIRLVVLYSFVCVFLFYLPFPVPLWLFHQNFKKNIFKAFITMALFPFHLFD